MSEFIQSCLAICNLCICLRSMRFIIFLRPSSFSTVILWHCNFVCDPSYVSELFVRLLIAVVILVVGEFNACLHGLYCCLWNILLDMLVLECCSFTPEFSFIEFCLFIVSFVRFLWIIWISFALSFLVAFFCFAIACFALWVGDRVVWSVCAALW